MVDEHVPVLADRVSSLLGPALIAVPQGIDPPARGPVLVDCTLGLGGHTTTLLSEYPTLRVIGIDRDPTALQMATERIAAAGFADRFSPAHAIYDEIEDVLAERGIAGVQGILFDLGVSSMQLDRTERGFAYSVDAPLDMRMNPTVGITAADVLNTYAPGEIVRVLREYGEEKFATRIVSEVVKRRKIEPWITSGPLVELIRLAIPAAARRTGGHPAKRTFQALRIEVNDELGVLRRAIPAAVRSLALGGRLAVISFQSLEDRIVKKALAPLTISTAPLDLPIELPDFAPELRWITRGSEAPTEAEILVNSRAASAKVRAAERIREKK